jgi:hypothetical protein
MAHPVTRTFSGSKVYVKTPAPQFPSPVPLAACSLMEGSVVLSFDLQLKTPWTAGFTLLGKQSKPSQARSMFLKNKWRVDLISDTEVGICNLGVQ